MNQPIPSQFGGNPPGGIQPVNGEQLNFSDEYPQQDVPGEPAGVSRAGGSTRHFQRIRRIRRCRRKINFSIHPLISFRGE